MEAVAEGYYRRIANFGTNWQPKLTPSSDYVLFFSKLLQMDSPVSKIAARSADAIREIEKNMLDAYKIFHGKLKEDFADDKGIWNTGKLIDLFNSFQSLDRFALLKIRVPNNRSAWQIFINLNKKGQDLQISDLVKAVLLSSIVDTERDPYITRWNSMKQTLEGIEFDQFLHHHFVANIKNVQEKKLYEEVDQNYKESQKAKDLIDKIVVSSEFYRVCVAPKDSDFTQTEQEIVHNLKAFKTPLGIIHAYPILLAGYTSYYKNGNANAFKNLVEYTLRFFIRARTICVEEPTKLEQFASTICEMIRSGKTISDIKDEFRNQQNSEALVLAKFKEKTKSTVRRDFFILEKINQWAYGQINSDLTTLAHSRKSVEHIMPENLTDEWINDLQKDPTAPTNKAQIKELHKAHLHKWGNLTPMNKWANSALQDELFSVKNNHAEGYKASNAEINQKIESFAHGIGTSDEWWDFGSISARTDELAKKAEEVFKIT